MSMISNTTASASTCRKSIRTRQYQSQRSRTYRQISEQTQSAINCLSINYLAGLCATHAIRDWLHLSSRSQTARGLP
eukprot:2133772-Rhodomonas_salina.3